MDSLHVAVKQVALFQTQRFAPFGQTLKLAIIDSAPFLQALGAFFERVMIWASLTTRKSRSTTWRWPRQ
jgi:hypothetical protein